MTKIKIDLDCLADANEKMCTLKDKVDNNIRWQSTIINNTDNYWEGQDHDKFKEKWDSFSNKYDKRIIEQTLQYFKYLNNFYMEANDAYNDINQAARKLPQ